MAFHKIVCFFLVCFFGFPIAAARYCSSSWSCYSGETCCSDNECKETCYSYCHYDFQCDTSKTYCDVDCKSSCPLSGGVIAAAVVSTIAFFGSIITIIVSCFYCACCPYYRYRSSRTMVVPQQRRRNQAFVTTTQYVHHYPLPVHSLNQPGVLPGYINQPPQPTFYSYPQPPVHFTNTSCH